MWLLIIVIVILIIYVVFLGKKEPEAKKNLLVVANDNTGTTPVVVQPAATVSAQTFAIGDQIYAGSDLLNTYKNCAPTSTNIDNTYSTGDLIGTFLRKEPLCIVIAVKTYPLGFSWIPFEGSKDVYLPLNALIYKQ